VPMFPFHTWLPDAHTEAPTAGSVILAGILLKMGLYGLVRFAMPLFPKGATDELKVQLVALLSIVVIIYGALVSLMQSDWKRLVAYSSVSHLGFCTLGLIALNPNGIAGGMLQGVNHGLSTPLLFLAVITGYLVSLLTNVAFIYNTLIGLAIVAAGFPFYFYWEKKNKGS